MSLYKEGFWYFILKDHRRGKKYVKKYVKIYGTFESTRDQMFRIYGDNWLYQLKSVKESRYEKYEEIKYVDALLCR